MTTVHKYLKGAMTPGGRHIFYPLNCTYILSNRFGLKRKIAILCIYRETGKNHFDITTFCTLPQHVASHFEKDQGNLK